MKTKRKATTASVRSGARKKSRHTRITAAQPQPKVDLSPRKSSAKSSAPRSPAKASTHSCASHHGDPKPAIDRASELLKAAGLKSTKPRQALLQAMTLFHTPFSTEELHARVSSRAGHAGDFDLVTVYRSLSTFTDLGIVSRVDFGDGVVRYELANADGTHHHHFVCKLCHRIEPLDFCEIKLQEDRLAQAGYSQLSHRLEFFGVCPECA